MASLYTQMPQAFSLPTTDEKSNILRRRPSDLSLVSLASDFSTFSSDSSNASTGTRPRRNRHRARREKQKKEPENLAAKAAAEMNLTQEEQSQYVALDCEMVGVGYKGKHSVLARVTLVDWDHNVVLDEFVKQDRPVTDYRTFVSGITADMLEQPTALDLETCRKKVVDAIQGKILVGHGLKNDLRALQMSLPWYSVRDTAKYEPFMKPRFDDGVLWPQSLKVLAKNRLRRDIQVPGEAHCPVEDAATAMDLYKVARRKWERAMEYKIKKSLEYEQLKQ